MSRPSRILAGRGVAVRQETRQRIRRAVRVSTEVPAIGPRAGRGAPVVACRCQTGIKSYSVFLSLPHSVRADDEWQTLETNRRQHWVILRLLSIVSTWL